MDIKHLVRNREAVHANLKEVGDTLVALGPMTIHLPESYLGTELADAGDHVMIVGIHALVVGNNYAVSSACALMEIAPSSKVIEKIEDVKYVVYNFEEGDTVYVNLNLTRTKTIPYRIYYKITANGNIPWYFDLTDHARLFETIVLHSGLSLGVNPAILEIQTSTLFRQDGDKTKYARHLNIPHVGRVSGKISTVKLESVTFGATNVATKIFGNRISEGIQSALVNPSEEPEAVEDLIFR